MNLDDAVRVRFDSWKAIAARLGRSVRTVQRWEIEERLPVHRLQLQQRGAVFAYQDELDSWWASRSQRLESQPAEAEEAAPVPIPALPRSRHIWLAAGLAALSGAVLLVSRTAATRHGPEPRIAVPLTTYSQDETDPAFSPNGEELAFRWDSVANNGDIFVKRRNGESTRRLTTDPRYDFQPKWSPDGATIAFWRRLPWEGAELILIPAAGGPERNLGEFHGPVASNLKVPAPYHAWMPDGRHLLLGVADGPGQPFRLTMLALADGRRTPLLDPPEGVLGDAGPAVSPEGRRLVFHRFLAQGTSQLFLAALKDGRIEGTPRAITFDKKFNANPVWIGEREIVFYGYRQGDMHLLRMNVEEPGRVSPAAGGALGSFPAYSAAGRLLAFTEGRNDDDIWRLPLASAGLPSGPPREFIRSSRQEAVPSYSPDGRWVALTSARSGYPNVWICDAGAPERCRQVTHYESSMTGPALWSPDGKRLAFGSNQTGAGEIYMIAADGGGQPRNLTDHPADELFPSWSRDGRWIYFGSNRSGRFEVWKQPLEGGTAVRVTSGGGYLPFESFDGRWLYYTRNNDSATSVWRIGLGAGAPAEEKLVDGIRRWYAVGRAGLYYYPRGKNEIWYWDAATGAVRLIAAIPSNLALGLAVSPDERELSFALGRRQGQDIMAFEGFR